MTPPLKCAVCERRPGEKSYNYAGHIICGRCDREVGCDPSITAMVATAARIARRAERERVRREKRNKKGSGA